MNSTTLKTQPLVTVAVAYAAFVTLGASFAMLGALWDPHIRQAFGLPLDGNAPLFLMNGLAYFMASFVAGRLTARFAISRVMLACMGLFVAGLCGQIAIPIWPVFIASSFVMSLGGGLLDATVNIVAAARFDGRLLNWLHACFGVGALAAPLLANLVLGAGGDWTGVYAVLLLTAAGVSALVARTRAHWHVTAAGAPAAARPASLRATLALPVVWIGIAMFLLYGGLEATGGNWLQTLFMSAHGRDEATARAWLGAFWISFTLGRVFFGFFAARARPATLITVCLLGAMAGGALLLLNPIPAAGWLGAALSAFMFGPLIAVLISITQAELGPQHAPNAIGMQIAMTSAGIAIIPSVVGAIVAAGWTDAIAASMLLIPAMLLGLHVIRQGLRR